MMKKIITVSLLILTSSNAIAASLFSGSLYMLDPIGNPSFENLQCISCNSLIGEIDNNLTTLIDSTGAADDLIGNNALLDVDLDWSISNLSFAINPDNTVSASGDFLWTNYSGLTISTFTQLFQPIGANGELVAMDGDSNFIKGYTMIDGPFQGSSIYLEGTISTIPVPAAVWLFGSGLIGLIGFAKRKKA